MQPTEWLNYHHLYYFWVAAKEGSLSRASDHLRLTRSTLSTQIRTLEVFLGGDLFVRSGRSMSLTALGRDVLSYAEKIFATGAELVQMARAKTAPHGTPLHVGVIIGMPQTIAFHLLAPVLAQIEDTPVRLHQVGFEQLLEQLAAGQLHLALSDVLPPQGSTASIFAQVIFESSVNLYGTPRLVRKYSPGFPSSIADAPMLLPSCRKPLRGLLENWFLDRGLKVRVAGEFDDMAMMLAFGGEGHGVFAVSSQLSSEIEQSFGVQPIGNFAGLSERFYALSPNRKPHRAELRALLESPQSRRLEKVRLLSAARNHKSDRN